MEDISPQAGCLVKFEMSQPESNRGRTVSAPQTYNDGRLYRPAAGRAAPKKSIVDYAATSHSVVSGTPDSEEFLRVIRREMKLRFYTSSTIKNYHGAVRRFVEWFGREPHRINREDVREYLEVLVDGGASSSHLGMTISAIRNVFDKMCCRQITLGLASPRKPSRQPVVLNKTEIRLMLDCARSLRDKLSMSLMYGMGLRVSEVCRLRWDELDFERRIVRVAMGKGQKDRQVILPDVLVSLMQQLASSAGKREYVFPGEGQRQNRHISPRTIQRMVANTAKLAGISKPVTPHSFRHSFATHLVEDGLDIRFIQKLLGHAKLETTTVYTRTAVLKQQQINSPLDQLQKSDALTQASDFPKPVGRMRLQLKFHNRNGERQADAVVTILVNDRPVVLDGIALRETRPGWIAMDIPPEEQWQASLERLSPEQRERVCSVEFLENLRSTLGQRFLAGRC